MNEGELRNRVTDALDDIEIAIAAVMSILESDEDPETKCEDAQVALSELKDAMC